MSRGRSFAPIIGPNVRVLILGSLPGLSSLRAGQYYAHPQNGFWRLVGGVIGVDLQGLAYPDRLASLIRGHIGVWDVISEATRPGSLDAAIRDHRMNDLGRLVGTLGELRAIGFNGASAAKLGRKALRDWDQKVALIDLPSSSPAYTLPLAQKAERWNHLGPYLNAPPRRLQNPP